MEILINYVDGLVQKRRNSSASALELPLFSIKPLMYSLSCDRHEKTEPSLTMKPIGCWSDIASTVFVRLQEHHICKLCKMVYDGLLSQPS